MSKYTQELWRERTITMNEKHVMIKWHFSTHTYISYFTSK